MAEENTEEKGKEKGEALGKGTAPRKKEPEEQKAAERKGIAERQKAARLEEAAHGKEERKGGSGGVRYIVRIATKDLNGNLPIYRALEKIKGVGPRMAKNIAIAFERETKVPFYSKLGLLPEELDKKLEEIVLNPGKYGVPAWSLNRLKEFETGEDKHLVMADLDLQLRKDLQRLNLIKSYRGLRHSWGLPVRGQRTKSTHRGKGPVVGVLKREARAALAAAGKGKEEEKK